MTVDTLPILPGRLGSPEMAMKDDPRADPRMIGALAPFSLDLVAEPPPVHSASPREQLLEFVNAAEPIYEDLFSKLMDLPPVENVTSHHEVIKGIDDNDITLLIHRPTNISGPLPGILHLHGGGMVFLTADGAAPTRWRNELAAAGLIVIGVQFRNGAGRLGPHPFPAGLNDCASGLQWVADNKDHLGISKVVVSGESGGGNLSLATALKAKQDGHLDQIDGVYAQCPCVSNAYADKVPDLPSLYENDNYFINCSTMAVLAKVYDPSSANATNPLAWPYHAQRADVEGLPPHVISVNELDLLRDEGLAYFRTLLEAGVHAIGRTVNGTCHAGDLICRAAMPDVFFATLRDVKSFADSL